MDSDGKIVTDAETYREVSFAAQVAYTSFIEFRPSDLRIHADLFGNIALYGTLRFALDKIGTISAGILGTKIQMLLPTLPSSKALAVSNLLGEIAKLSGKGAEVALHGAAIGMLKGASLSLKEASEILKPVYKDLESDFEAKVKFEDMIRAYTITRKGYVFGDSGIIILTNMYKEHVWGYLKSVAGAIVGSADPKGAVKFALGTWTTYEKYESFKEFSEALKKAESNFVAREEAFRKGVEKFVKLASEVASLKEGGDLGASIAFREGAVEKVDIHEPSINIRTETGYKRVTVTVSSTVPEGRTFVIDIDEDSLPISEIREVMVLFDGREIHMADDYADVLNPHDEDEPEYLVFFGARGVQVIVSIPSFSTRTITVAKIATFEVSDLVIKPAAVTVGEALSVMVDVTNTGGIAGAHTVELKVNGVVEATKDVILEGGETKTVTFTLTKDVGETYDVEIDGLTKTLIVTPKPTNWLLVGIIATLMIALVAVLSFRKACAPKEPRAVEKRKPTRMSLEETKFCYKCGSEMPVDAGFCPKCGRKN